MFLHLKVQISDTWRFFMIVRPTDFVTKTQFELLSNIIIIVALNLYCNHGGMCMLKVRVLGAYVTEFSEGKLCGKRQNNPSNRIKYLKEKWKDYRLKWTWILKSNTVECINYLWKQLDKLGIKPTSLNICLYTFLSQQSVTLRSERRVGIVEEIGRNAKI